MVNQELLTSYLAQAMTIGAERGLNLTTEPGEQADILSIAIVVAGLTGLVALSTIIINGIKAYQIYHDFYHKDQGNKPQKAVQESFQEEKLNLRKKIILNPRRQIRPEVDDGKTIHLTQGPDGVSMPRPTPGKVNRTYRKPD
ncbi:hypothetical protein KBD75_02420 [Candidatus Woesebacteria bacterium]|nr:hypothetical protein [Candidatus Woesebacteria bacterium]